MNYPEKLHYFASSRFTPTILILIFITAPGSHATPFNGLPLSALEALAAITLLLVCWAPLPRITRGFSKRLTVTLVILTGLQLIGWMVVPYGWSVCLRREVAVETLTTSCEPTVENRHGQRSNITPHISYKEKSFPLHFMNDKKAFNFHDGNGPDRGNLRYSFAASAFFRQQPQSLIITTNIPRVTVTLNGQVHSLIPDETLELNLNNQVLNHVTLTYTTNNSGDSDALHVRTAAFPFFSKVSQSVPPNTGVYTYRFISWIALTYVIIMTASRLWELARTIPINDLRWYLYSTVWAAPLFIIQSSEPAVFALGLIGMMIACCHISMPTWQKSWPIPILLFLVYAAVFVSLVLPPGHVKILDGGDDPLTHEGYSRISATADNLYTFLEGGSEGLFFYQPLYSYLVAMIHIFGGESLWAVYATQTFLFILTIILAGRLIFRLGGAPAMSLFAILLISVLITEEHSWVKLAATSTYQEALGLPFLLLAALATLTNWLSNNRSYLAHFGIGLLWGLAVMTRTDFLPALLAPAVYAAAAWRGWPTWSQRWHLASYLCTGAAIAPLFVGLRNVIIARQWAILPTSGYGNLLPQFKDVLPVNSAETFGIKTLLIDLPFAYATRPFEFLAAAWGNIAGAIGNDYFHLTLWAAIIVLSIFLISFSSNKIRLTALILLLSMLMPVIFRVFFDFTNILPAIAHYSFLAAFLLPSLSSMAVLAWRQKTKPTANQQLENL